MVVIAERRSNMDTNKKSTFEVNKEMIARYVDIHPEDTEIIDNTINQLTEMGVGTINSVELLDTGELLLTNNDDQMYYLILTDYGCIALLKKDGPQGEELLSVRCGVMKPELPADAED